MDEQTGMKRHNVLHATFFHELLEGDFTEEEKQLDRLWLEG